MTIKELMELKEGTLLYNGRTEGEIVTDYGIKCIKVLIPIKYMSNMAKDKSEQPEWWDVLED